MPGTKGLIHGLWRKTSPAASAFDNAVLRGLPIDKEEQNFVRSAVAGACYSRVAPTPIESPELVIAAPDALQLVGIQVWPDEDPACQQDHAPVDELATLDHLVPYLAGNTPFDGSQTAAQCYCGHQFGYFSGQLGDGAAIYLGEIVRGKGERWEMQLKGAGKTPYSRTADGRKVLRSTLREFLASEHMHALGVPTTRAGSVVVSRSTTVVRDMFYDGNAKHEPVAVVMRIAKSFLRFGSFEIFKETDEKTGRAGPSARLPYKRAIMRQMLDFTIRQYFPEIERQELPREQAYVTMLKEVVERTARLVAKWQSIGFCHGVLNTDNMSIVGDTLDYGPYGFMEHFNPQHVCNTSDDGGRYRFEAQPEICQWNCGVLADQLALVVEDRAALDDALAPFEEVYKKEYYALMRSKLGLLHKSLPEEDAALVDALMATLTETGADVTCTFRLLADVKAFGKKATQEAVIAQLVEVCETLAQQKRRLQVFTEAQYQSVEMLMKMNPAHALSFGITPEMFEQMTAQRAKVAALDAIPGGDRQHQQREAWRTWLAKYTARLQQETDGEQGNEAHEFHRRDHMRAVNPVVVLRNHVAQAAIDAATEGDYEEVQRIFELLTHPFDEPSDPLYRHLTRPQDPATPPLCVSCSS